MTTKTAFNRAVVTWKLKYKQNNPIDYVNLLDQTIAAVKDHLLRERHRQRAIKFNMSLHAVFEKAVDSSIVTDPPTVLVTDQFEVYAVTDLDECLQQCSMQLHNRIECYEGTGSGWILSHLVTLDTTTWILDPLRVSTFHSLPKWIQNTKCIRNIQNFTDNMCFKWSVLTGLYETTDSDHVQRISSYNDHENHEDAPNFSMLTYPVELRSIAKFEKANNISINVYTVMEEEVKISGKRKSNPTTTPAKRRVGSNSQETPM